MDCSFDFADGNKAVYLSNSKSSSGHNLMKKTDWFIILNMQFLYLYFE